MTTGRAPLTELPAWKALEAHYQQVRGLHLRKLFKDDPGRGERMTAEAVGLYLDYSKNRLTDETLKLLAQLAEASGLRARIDAMRVGLMWARMSVSTRARPSAEPLQQRPMAEASRAGSRIPLWAEPGTRG